jgi:hypothetical protein
MTIKINETQRSVAVSTNLVTEQSPVPSASVTAYAADGGAVPVAATTPSVASPLTLQAPEQFHWFQGGFTERSRIKDDVKWGRKRLPDIPERYRDDLEIMLLGINWVPDGFKYASHRLKSDRASVIEAVKVSALSIGAAADPLREDRGILEIARTNRGWSRGAIAGFGEGIRSDPQLMLHWAQAIFPDMMDAIPDSLMKNKEFAKQFVMTVKAYDSFPQFHNDVDFNAAAIAHDPDLLFEMTGELAGHPKLVQTFLSNWGYTPGHNALTSPLGHQAASLAYLVRACPQYFQPVIDELPADLQAEYRALEANMKKLGIEHPEYFADYSNLGKAIQNRLTLDPSDQRPIAVVLYPKEGSSYLFTNNDVGRLNQHYRLLYYEAGSERAVAAALEDARRHGQADLVLLSGGGSPTDLQFGRGRSDSSLIDASDANGRLSRALAAAVKPGGAVVLEGAFSGAESSEPGQPKKAIADHIAAWVPQAEVRAPRFTVQMNSLARYPRRENSWQLDAQGKYVGDRAWQWGPGSRFDGYYWPKGWDYYNTNNKPPVRVIPPSRPVSP